MGTVRFCHLHDKSYRPHLSHQITKEYLSMNAIRDEGKFFNDSYDIMAEIGISLVTTYSLVEAPSKQLLLLNLGLNTLTTNRNTQLTCSPTNSECLNNNNTYLGLMSIIIASRFAIIVSTDKEKGIYRNRGRGTFVYKNDEGLIEAAQLQLHREQDHQLYQIQLEGVFHRARGNRERELANTATAAKAARDALARGCAYCETHSNRLCLPRPCIRRSQIIALLLLGTAPLEPICDWINPAPCPCISTPSLITF